MVVGPKVDQVVFRAVKNTRKNTTPIQVTLASLARNYIENMISYQVLVHESYLQPQVSRRLGALGPTGESHSKVDCARTIQSFENLTIYKMTGSTLDEAVRMVLVPSAGMHRPTL